MSNDNTYNGWTNYETWNVNLHIDNSYGSHRYWRERAEECTTSELAEELKWAFEDDMPELDATYGDLLGAALSNVNWYEIAEALIEEVKE